MRASLDTNAVIHFYRAGLQHILFDLFDDGVCIDQTDSSELKTLAMIRKLRGRGPRKQTLR